MDRDVVVAEYDSTTHGFTKILSTPSIPDVPPEALDPQGRVTLRGLNGWWRSRSIPMTRDGARRLEAQVGEGGMPALLERGLGLSLSDAYWVVPERDGAIRWADVNFFENDFPEELGVGTMGCWQEGSSHEGLWGPSASTSGDLKKAWIVQDDGTRALQKAGRGVAAQEPYNEVAATRLYEQVMPESDYVAYELIRRGNSVYSLCPDLVAGGEDLIPAYALVFNYKRPGSLNAYDWCMAALSRTGAADLEMRLCRMLACDFVLANHDRHYGNFGVVRDADTLEFRGMAPIYDNGNSLWCDKQFLDTPASFAYEPLPFGASQNPARVPNPAKQLGMLRDWSWYEPKMFASSPELVREVLAADPNLPESRVDAVAAGVRRNVRVLEAEAARGATRVTFAVHIRSVGARIPEATWERATTRGMGDSER